MKERALYYAKQDFYELIKSVGGEWNDTKRRPLVCLVKSTEHEGLYWAIPLGNLRHRTLEAQKRINTYLNFPVSDIRSCYYHIGRTTNKSIFFISDAVPIIDKYIDCEHLGADNNPYTIKNIGLAQELERKLKRILSIENSNPNSFRQHITDVKNMLIKELNEGII